MWAELVRTNIQQDYPSLTYLEVRLAALMLKKVALDSIATALACEDTDEIKYSVIYIIYQYMVCLCYQHGLPIARRTEEKESSCRSSKTSEQLKIGFMLLETCIVCTL